MPRIAVVGMWHLGTVTAACFASAGHTVVGLDQDRSTVEGLAAGKPPISEPGLADMVAAETAAGRLRFSTDFAEAAYCDVLWIAYDTPVDENDVADVPYVHGKALQVLQHAREGAVLVVSSQMPAGSVATLEREAALVLGGRTVYMACVPENLRLGKALDVFLRPDRVVLGVRDAEARAALEAVYAPITDRLVWMSVESAEMTKHSINAFLAMSVCFINELAAICEATGADVQEVEQGLKTDQRIGPQAYLRAGGAIAGGTLARDIGFLRALGKASSLKLPLIDGVHASNELHKTWLQRRLIHVLGELAGRRFSILGLTYKPGTDTLRRSSAVEIAQWLHARGAVVRAFDPAVQELPADLQPVLTLGTSIGSVLQGADALLLMTPWPEFLSLDAAAVPNIVFDPMRFLKKALRSRTDLRYLSVGGTK